MIEDQIYALVLVSSWHSSNFYSKNGIGCRKEFLHLVRGQVSSNHREQVVSKENSVALWFLNKRESTALSDPNCLFFFFLYLLFKAQWIFQLKLSKDE